ncbi:hypothetical protein OAA67_04695 [Winogradskyella sp.]|nr:hypothetical protein [Winogradskyella sp.]
MKKSVLATFIMYSALTMQAQEIILASGGNATGSGGSVSYSIGQVFYNTNTSTEGSIEEGVQIPVFKLKFTNGSWLPMAPSASTGSNEVFVIDGIYTVTTDVAVKDLDLSSGAAVVVEPNHTLNINGDLTMNSISNSFSSLVVKGNAPVAGSSIYHRYVNAQLNRNDLITPPMDGQSWSSFLNNNSSSNASALFTNGLTGMSTLYLFGPYEKGSTDDYLIYSNSTIATLTAGKGYRAATNTATINGNGETLTFEGSVLTSPVNVDIVDDQTGNYAEWNLVGNPFPAYLDITEFLNHEVSPGVSNLSLLDANSAAIYGYDGDDTDGSF